MTKPQQVQEAPSPGSATPAPTTTNTKTLVNSSTGNAATTTATATTTTTTTMENVLIQQGQIPTPTPTQPSNKDASVDTEMIDGTENIQLQTNGDDDDTDMDYDGDEDLSDPSEHDGSFGDDEYDGSDMDSSFVDEAELELQQHLAQQNAMMHDHFDDEFYNDDDGAGEFGYWAQRCSICFDATMDICLNPCRDQYCNECFQKYVTEVVMSSWGLSVVTLKCPVCRDIIPRNQWSQFVPQSVVDHYDRFNQPYRSFARCCPQCEKEAKPCDYSLKVAGVDYMKRIRDMMRSLTREDYGVPTPNKNENNDSTVLSNGGNRHSIYATLRSLLARLDGNDFTTSILDVYRDTLNTLSIVEQTCTNSNKSSSSSVSELCRAISYAFTLLDMNTETWKQMQFIYITHFPNIICEHCHLEFCLQCGSKAHGKLTCEDAMRNLIGSAPQDQESVLMAQWYLNNSRRCPNCAIMIDRNEGCNQVDCSLCGYCFCWVCRQPWSDKCGFFQCQAVEESSTKANPTDTESGKDQKSELGVPDISSIQARLATNHPSPLPPP